MRPSIRGIPAVLLCFVAHLCAQGVPSAQVPVIKTSARAVSVDVAVTKGNGEPVFDLHKQDFQIMEDGKPQVIDYFEEHTSKPSSPVIVPPLPAMQPDVYTNVPPAPLSDAVNVLLLDTLNTAKADQMFVHKQIVEFIKHIHPGTRVAIFTLGSKLRFVQGFTSDTAVLQAALNGKKGGVSAEKDPASRSRTDDAADAEQIQTMIMLAGGFTSGIAAVEDSQRDFSDMQSSDRTAMTLEALNYLARYLSGIPGRKNLIWFSSSFPVTIFPIASQRLPTSSLQGYSKQVRQTADLLTASNVAVYPVNTQGLAGEQRFDVEDSGPNSRREMYSGAAAESSDSANTMYAMQNIASDTGGKAYYNTNDLAGALSRAIDDGSNFYTLVYTPANKEMDGRYRHIEIKLTQGRYKLAYRRGYNADDNLPAETDAASNPLGQLMKHGMPGLTGILYRVKVVPSTIQPENDDKLAGMNPNFSGPRTRYFVEFMIPPGDLALALEPSGMHTGKIKLALLAFGPDGNPLNWLVGNQSIHLDPDLYAAVQKSGIPVHMEIDLPGADDFLDTGVYDWNSGKAGTLEIPLRTATAAATPPASPKAN